MEGLTASLFRRTRWGLHASFLLVAVAPVFYLIWDLLPRLTYGSVEYELSVLATLGTAGCLGHLVVRAYQNSGSLCDVSSLFSIAPTPDVCSSAETSVDSADWPLLVALLFGPFSLLLAGFGGWV